MSDPSFKLRIERLSRGEIRPADLISLFLGAREVCGGRETVKEIGDFTAHKGERTRGATTRELRNFMADLRFKYQHFDSSVPMGKLPIDFGEILERNLHRNDPMHLREETGLTVRSAAKVLSRIVDNLRSNGADGLQLAKPTDQDELSLINYLTTYLTVRPAFTAERLVKEFIDTLIENDLVNDTEAAKFSSSVKSAIALFAITQIHGSRVRLEDGSSVDLRGMVNSNTNRLCVGAYTIVHRMGPDGSTLRVLHGSPVFETALSPDDWCEGILSQRPFAPWWSRPLELSPTGKLCLMNPNSDLAYPSLGRRAAMLRT